MRNIFFLSIVLFIEIGNVCSAQKKSFALIDNQVRFTVISDGVIRMEWDANCKFVDAFSFVAVNRIYVPVDNKVKYEGKWVESPTSKMMLRYKKGSGKFNEKNLSITSSKKLGTSFVWTSGMKQSSNVKGIEDGL